MLSRRGFTLAGLAAISTACRAKRSPGFDGYAYVANQTGNAIAVVDLTAFTLVRHIAVDDAPTAILADPKKPQILALAPASGTIYEIDSVKHEIRRKVRVGPSIGMQLFERSVWVLGRQELIQVPLESLQPAKRIALSHEAFDFDLSNWNGLSVVGHGPAGGVSVIDLKAGTTKARARLSDAIGTVRFRSDGEGIVAADIGNRRLCVLDQSAHRIANLPLAVRPENLCFNQDGGQLFITGEGQDGVVVVFPYFVPQTVETILAGHAPGAMAASPTHLYVASPQAGDVSIISIARRKVVAVATVGADPGYIALTPDNNYVLVLNRQSGDMAVIKTSAAVPNPRKTAALFTMIPVGSRPVSAAVKSA